MKSKRLIGKFIGSRPGPMLICFGGIHGNEPAGVKALDLVFKMLEVEPITNKDFEFCGSIVGIKGNIPALQEKKRYIHKDLNRIWDPDTIRKVDQTAAVDLKISEERELKRILRCIRREISLIQPEKIVFLDLHTTTAHGGIFSIVPENEECLTIAQKLHAPVVKGMRGGLKGTTQEFFDSVGSKRDAIGLIFESGQHDDPLSVNRAIAALINCMRSIGCIDADSVENIHDQLLIDFSKDLPKVVKLEYTHKIKMKDQFKMLPGFKNFQKVKKGQLLAEDRSGPIHSQKTGHILMPLYQKQGEDGFFIVSAEQGA